MVTRVIRPGTRIDIGTTGPVIVADPRTEAPAVAAPPPPQELPDDRLAGAGLSGDVPALLLPMRIETRWMNAGADTLELWVRLFPDVIHVAEERPDLSQQELDLARRYIDAEEAAAVAAAAGGEPADRRRAAWDEAVNALGAPRATFAILRVRDGATAVAEPAEGVTAAHLLPSRIALVLEGTGFRRVAWGADIVSPLPAGIAAPEEEPTRWQFDFDAAERAGLALRVPFDRAQAQALTRIIGIGLRDGAPAGHTTLLGAHLGRQFASAGSALVAVGTPTNNTDDARSGFDSATRADDQAAAIEHMAQPLAADADGSRLARAFGVDESLFRPLAGARARGESEAAMLHAALWPGTLGTWLVQLMDPAVPAEAQAFMRDLFVNDVRARGPLPALRIGRQPYGVLPVTSLARWVGDAEQAARILHTLRAHWQAQASPPTLHRGGDKATLRAVLAQGPRSTRLTLRRARPAEAGYPAAALAGLEQAWTAVEPALRALGIAQRPDLSRFIHDPQAHWSRIALVAPRGADRRQPLAANYLRALATAATGLALRSHEAVGNQPPATLLYVLARAGLLEIALSIVKEVFGITSVTVRDHRGGTDVIRVERAWRMLTRTHERLGNQSVSDVMAAIPTRLQTIREGALPVALPEWVGLTTPVRALRAALAGIADLPVERLERGLLEALDATAHRLDAWVTALAARRLRQQRQAAPDGVHIGAWAHVGAPPVPPPPDPHAPARTAGFEFAPSLAHARTAALLRSAFEASRGDAPQAGPGGDQEHAVDLSSARVRSALDLVQLARAGCSVGEALGRRLERWLVDHDLGPQTPALREQAPLGGGRFGIDGVALAAAWQRELPGAPLADAAAQLIEWVDELADLMLAEGLHQIAGGRRERARAVLEAIERGEVLPEQFDIVAGPASGAARPWRLALEVPAGGGWPGSGSSVRALAAPALESLAAAWLGPPEALTWTVQGRGAEGDGSVSLSPLDMGLGALDVVALSRRGETLVALAKAAARLKGWTTIATITGDEGSSARLLTARMLARLFDAAPRFVADAAATLARVEAAIEALRRPDATLRRMAWTGGIDDVTALDERLAAAPAAVEPLARLDALAGIRATEARAEAIAPALDALQTLGAPSLHAWLHDMGRVRPAVAALGAMALAQGGLGSGGVSVRDEPDGTRLVIAAPPPGGTPGASSALLTVDRWSEPLPGAPKDAAAALQIDAPRARAPQALLLAVSPTPGQPWTLSTLADVVAETLDMLPLRAVAPGAVAGHYLPAAMVADDLDGEALGPLPASAFRAVIG